MVNGVQTQAVPGRKAWYTLAILTLIYMFHSVDRSVMSIVIEPVKKEFGLSDGQIGLLTGLAYGVTFALASVPIGLLIDRLNRRNLLASLLIIWSGCTAICGFVQSYAGLLAARLAVGAAESGGAPVSMSMIADLFPKDRRSTAMGLFWTSTALGTALSFVLGGYVAVQYGWRAAFLVAGVPGVLLGVLLFLTVQEPVRGGADTMAAAGPAPSLPTTWRYAIRQPVLVHVFVAITLNSAVLSGVIVWAPSFLIRTQGLDLTQTGLITGAAAGISGLIGSFAGGPLGDRVTRRRGLRGLPIVPAITSLLAAFAGILLAVSPNLPLAVLGLVLFEIVGRTYTAPGYSIIVATVEPRMRGITLSSLQMATNLIGYGLGPFLVGAISDLVGGAEAIRYGLMALMGVGLWGSLHFLLALRAAASLPERNADDTSVSVH